jgi:hypothetical protein
MGIEHGLDSSFQSCSLGPPTFPPSIPPSLPPSHLCATTTVVLPRMAFSKASCTGADVDTDHTKGRRSGTSG